MLAQICRITSSGGSKAFSRVNSRRSPAAKRCVLLPAVSFVSKVQLLFDSYNSGGATVLHEWEE